MATTFNWITNWPYERGIGDITLVHEPHRSVVITTNPEPGPYAGVRWYALNIEGPLEERTALDEETLKDLIRVYYNGREKNET